MKWKFYFLYRGISEEEVFEGENVIIAISIFLQEYEVYMITKIEKIES